MSSIKEIKLGIIGNSGVGKACICKHLSKDISPSQYISKITVISNASH